MKSCAKCGSTKPFEAFYRLDSARDGRMSTCSECHKQINRINRLSNIEKAREYDRQRAQLPHRVAARKAYAKTDRYRLSHNESSLRFSDTYPEKRAAHRAVRAALRSGSMDRGSCEWCGKQPAHAHHFDYGKPLDVTWLCTEHHALVHKCDRNHKRKVSNA